MKRKSIREVVEDPDLKEFYVLVTRYYPMELRRRALTLIESPIDIWDRDLAPSKELLKRYKETGSWSTYLKEFKEEVPRDFVMKKFAEFEKKANGKEVVLVCVEKDYEYPCCHTWILLEEY